MTLPALDPRAQKAFEIYRGFSTDFSTQVARQCNYFCLMKAGPSSSPERPSCCGLTPLFASLFTFVPLWIEAEVEALLLIWYICILAPFVSPAYLKMSLYIWKMYLQASINAGHVIYNDTIWCNTVWLWKRFFHCKSKGVSIAMWATLVMKQISIQMFHLSFSADSLNVCMVHSWDHSEDCVLHSPLSTVISTVNFLLSKRIAFQERFFITHPKRLNSKQHEQQLHRWNTHSVKWTAWIKGFEITFMFPGRLSPSCCLGHFC